MAFIILTYQDKMIYRFPNPVNSFCNIFTRSALQKCRRNDELNRKLQAANVLLFCPGTQT